MKPSPTRPALRESLEPDFGKDAEMIAAAARNAIFLTDTESAAGASRAFGDPELPEDMKWPWFAEPLAKLKERFKPSSVDSVAESFDGEIDVPFAFIVQVDLAAIAAHDVEGKLPHEGLLSFFFRPDLMFEDDTGYNLPCRVVHNVGARAAVETPSSLEAWALPAIPIGASHGYVLPGSDQLPRELERGRERYVELLQQQLDLPEDQMLAFPTGTYGDGVPPEDGQVLLSTRLPPSMFDGSFSWAYFCISDADLAARRFDRVVVRISTE